MISPNVVQDRAESKGNASMKIAVPDLISNSYFPVVAAVELGCFKEQRQFHRDSRARQSPYEKFAMKRSSRVVHITRRTAGTF
jgi:hypothetical protein